MTFNLFAQVIEINPGGAFGTFLEFLYVFIIGSFLGYIAEVLFRRFVSMKRWINPGFLRGPCLPLYGFGLGTLHLICVYTFQYLCDPSTVPAYYSSLAIGNGPLPFWAVCLISIALIGIGMTLIEYIAGLIFVKGLHIKLWDYSNLKGNIQGIICPLFSFIWLIAGTIYLFGISPALSEAIDFLVSRLWGMTFLLGGYFSIFCLDFINSLLLSLKLSGNARKLNLTVDFEKFKILQVKTSKNSRLALMAENIKKSAQPLSDKINKFNTEFKKHLYIGNEIPEKAGGENDETPRTKKINKDDEIKS